MAFRLSAPLISSARPKAPPTSDPGSAPVSQGPASPWRAAGGGVGNASTLRLTVCAGGPAAGRLGAVVSAHGRWGRALIGAEAWAGAGQQGAAQALRAGAGSGLFPPQRNGRGARVGADLWGGRGRGGRACAARLLAARRPCKAVLLAGCLVPQSSRLTTLLPTGGS